MLLNTGFGAAFCVIRWKLQKLEEKLSGQHLLTEGFGFKPFVSIGSFVGGKWRIWSWELIRGGEIAKYLGKEIIEDIGEGQRSQIWKGRNLLQEI